MDMDDCVYTPIAEHLVQSGRVIFVGNYDVLNLGSCLNISSMFIHRTLIEQIIETVVAEAPLAGYYRP